MLVGVGDGDGGGTTSRDGQRGRDGTGGAEGAKGNNRGILDIGREGGKKLVVGRECEVVQGRLRGGGTNPGCQYYFG